MWLLFEYGISELGIIKAPEVNFFYYLMWTEEENIKIKNRNTKDYRDLLIEGLKDRETFVLLIMSRKKGDYDFPWTKITVRPVEIKGKIFLQFKYFESLKHITKNHEPNEVGEKIIETLSHNFSEIHLHSTEQDLHIKITRKGNVLINKGKPTCQKKPDLSHDRIKEYPLDSKIHIKFLQAIGVVNSIGEIKPNMHRKFIQVNEFIRSIEIMVKKLNIKNRPIRIIDYGCGKAYLTFAAYYYIKEILKIPVNITGIDTNEDIIAKAIDLRDSINCEEITFFISRIEEFEPEETPDMTLSLHACDTATDEAISRGIILNSKIIIAVPCCQHELHHKLTEPLFKPVIQHGILRERLADIITDSLRASVLRIMGYNTDVIEFVSVEHTKKNVMIRAFKTTKTCNDIVVAEYRRFVDFWGITPAIQIMLGERFEKCLKNYSE